MAPPIFIRSTSSIGSPSEEALSMSSPGICQCENQLAHWDWVGRPHENLPVQCRRRPAIEEDDSVAASEYSNNENPKVKVESDSEEVKQARLIAPNASTDEQDIASCATKGTNSTDKKAPACTKRKREGNSGGRTCKKRKSTSIRIKFSGGASKSSIEISVTTSKKMISIKI